MTTDDPTEPHLNSGGLPLTLEAKALKTTKTHAMVACGLGLVPFPFFDLAAILGTQLNLLGNISGIYSVPFTRNIGKSAIAALVGTYGSLSLTSGSIGSLMKAIPGVGTLTGMATLPILAGATTYAIGKVFIQHFESGGTFLDFDPNSVKEYYAQQFNEGQLIVSKEKMSKDKAKTTEQQEEPPSSDQAS